MLEIQVFTGGIAQTNGYCVVTPSAVLAVDAPEGMARWLREQGVTVSHLLLTHQHFDHCQDAAEIQREHGAEILAFAAFSRELTLEFLISSAGRSFSIEPFVVNEVLEGRSEVAVGGINWNLAHVPGHSLDSITFYYREENLLFAGDVLFAGSIGRTDFPGGSLSMLLQGLKEHVLSLPEDTIVLPGHGPETTVGHERADNPYLDI
ncbi:MAG: MBL fold metallo-hydrolase [Roseimicrobium sp.]